MEELISKTPGDGAVAGIGLVNSSLLPEDKARCLIIGYDYTILAGTQGYFGHKKKDSMLRLADGQRLPVVLFPERGGSRPGDVDADGGAARFDLSTFALFAKLSGKIPLVGLVSSRCLQTTRFCWDIVT